MYLAYSAINASSTQPQTGEQHEQINSEIALRYQAYQNVCNKYSHEIAAIQKYLPGWMPKFR
ncbi:MAG: hypothetical protein JWR02_1485 [Mucilaginibacter sp.]|nr:hypothetical protein [Mucilaginibacter sp.]